MQNFKQNLIYYKKREHKAWLSRIPKILTVEHKQDKTKQDYDCGNRRQKTDLT